MKLKSMLPLLLIWVLPMMVKAQVTFESSHYVAPLFQEELRISGADTATYYQYELYDTTETATYTHFWCQDSAVGLQPVAMRLNFFANQPVNVRLPEHFTALQPTSYAVAGMIEVYVLEKGILIKDGYHFQEFVYLESPKPFWRPETKGGFSLLTMPFERDGAQRQIYISLDKGEATIDYFILAPGETEVYSLDACVLRFDKWMEPVKTSTFDEKTRKI